MTVATRFTLVTLGSPRTFWALDSLDSLRSLLAADSLQALFNTDMERPAREHLVVTRLVADDSSGRLVDDDVVSGLGADDASPTDSVWKRQVETLVFRELDFFFV